MTADIHQLSARKLTCRGVSRDAESPGQTAVLVIFSRKLTNGEMRFFHEVCERTAPLMDGEVQ